LSKIYINESKKIKVCDTFGWGDEHFRNVSDLLLAGKLPDNYQLSDPTEKYSYRQLNLDYDQRPHAVIILYSALKINDKVSLHKLMDNCKRIVERF
jgi:hypothetical protein